MVQNQLVLDHKSRPKSENSYRGRGFFILGFGDEISGYYHRKKTRLFGFIRHLFGMFIYIVLINKYLLVLFYVNL